MPGIYLIVFLLGAVILLTFFMWAVKLGNALKLPEWMTPILIAVVVVGAYLATLTIVGLVAEPLGSFLFNLQYQ